ncbi:MAG: dihydropteroate synthase [Chloroflexi bacterium]|nr:dihydropteroate synthase [Chloroflexota bacterium]
MGRRFEGAEVRESGELICGSLRLPLGKRTLVMGVLNLTPDSFSGDGIAGDWEAAVLQGRRLVAEGADILDIGGESTRPKSLPITEEEELARVLPVVEHLTRELDCPISVDTSKATVAELALQAGAHIINDITALRGDPAMAGVVASYKVPLVLMHMKGTPRDMQINPVYDDVVDEVGAFLQGQVERAVEAGIDRSQIIVDPGIGFGKTGEHNLEILRRLEELKALGQPLLVGTSRKSFVGRILGGLPAQERVWGTAATVSLSIAKGADIVRVHDVAAMVQVARVADAVVRGWNPSD